METIGEIWKAVEDEDVEGWYEVSNQGRVRSNCGKQKILKPWVMSAGYLQVGLRRTDKTIKRGYKAQLVSHLVAKAFLPEPRLGQDQVNHISGVKTDNRPANLEWVDCKANIQHSIETGLNTRKPIVLYHSPTGLCCVGITAALNLANRRAQTVSDREVFRHRVLRGVESDWKVVPAFLISSRLKGIRSRSAHNIAFHPIDGFKIIYEGEIIDAGYPTFDDAIAARREWFQPSKAIPLELPTLFETFLFQCTRLTGAAA